MSLNQNFSKTSREPQVGLNRYCARLSKRVLFSVVSIILFTCVYAEDSKEFTFIWDLLDALKLCRDSIEYRVTTRILPNKMISDTEAANVNFEKAKHILEKYTVDKDKNILKVVTKIVNGIDILVYSNDVLLAKIENIAGLHPYGFENTEFETARFRAQSKKGWNEFFSSLSGLAEVIIDTSQDKSSAGRSLFKISKEEGQKLVDKINELFGKSLETYDKYQELRKQEDAVLDLPARFVIAVGTIKDLLTDLY
jgi:hypothetical protein